MSPGKGEVLKIQWECLVVKFNAREKKMFPPLWWEHTVFLEDIKNTYSANPMESCTASFFHLSWLPRPLISLSPIT